MDGAPPGTCLDVAGLEVLVGGATKRVCGRISSPIAAKSLQVREKATRIVLEALPAVGCILKLCFYAKDKMAEVAPRGAWQTCSGALEIWDAMQSKKSGWVQTKVNRWVWISPAIAEENQEHAEENQEPGIEHDQKRSRRRQHRWLATSSL